MSNSLAKNYSTKIIPVFQKSWTNDTVSLNSVNRDMYRGGINPTTGSTVQIKRPHQYNTHETAAGDISGVTKSSLIAATSTMTVNNWLTAAVEWEAFEEAYELNQLDQILAPMNQKLITDEEVRLNAYIKDNGAHILGTVGTDIDAWSDIAQVGSFSKSLGFPSGKMYAQVDPYAIQDLSDAQTGLLNDGLVGTAWKEAQIGRKFGGVNVFESNSLATHTVGSHDSGITLKSAPTQTYAGAKDTYLTTLVLQGLDVSTTGVLKQGDMLRITGRYWNQMQTKQEAAKRGAGIEYTCTVTADVNSDGSGDVTVIVSGPAIYEAAGQYNTVSSALATNDVVTVVSGTADTTNVPSLFYHADAFAYNQVKTPKLHALDSMLVNSPDGRVNLRIHKYSDGDTNTQKLRIDLLSAYSTCNPLWAGRLFGN